MDVSRPYAVISSPLDLEVLLVLRRTTRPLTGREVARLVRKGSEAGVRKALARLTRHGLVRAEEAGRAYMHTLNREHVAAPALEVLATMRSELEGRLADEIEGWGVPPAHVSLFGSAARGDGDTASDIDLFLVRPGEVDEGDPVWREQVSRLADHVDRWTGNRLAVAEVDAQDVRRLRRDRPAIVESLSADAVTIAGPDAIDLLGSGA
jgi:predicted nucleotidyltransferase